MNEYFFGALLSVFLSAIAQALLKKSSQIHRASLWREYCNPYVLIAYAMMAGCVLLMIVAYKGIPYKYGPVIESLGYFYFMALGRICFKERITWNRLVGNIFIVVGIIIFSL